MYSYLPSCPFHCKICLTLWRLPLRFGRPLDNMWTLGQALYCLLNDSHALLHLGHTHPIPAHGIKLLVRRNLKVKSVIYRIWFSPAHVVCLTGAAKHRPCGPVSPAHFKGYDAYFFDSLAQDDVVCNQVLVHRQTASEIRDELQHALQKILGEIGRDPARPEKTICQTRARRYLQEIQEIFPVIECVHNRGKGPQVEDVRPPPDKMRGDAVEFNGDDPDVLGPLRHLDLAQAFHRANKGPVPGEWVKVVDPAHVRHVLKTRFHLGHLFVHTMEIADHRLGPENVFAVKLKHYPEHPVCGRMLRPHVQNQGVLAGPWFNKMPGVKIPCYLFCCGLTCHRCFTIRDPWSVR